MYSSGYFEFQVTTQVTQTKAITAAEGRGRKWSGAEGRPFLAPMKMLMWTEGISAGGNAGGGESAGGNEGGKIDATKPS